MPAKLRPLVLHAYDIIGELTPLRGDCGQLCGAACCEGDDDIGMLLFPGEAKMLWRVPGFQVTRIEYMDSRAWLLTCKGPCPRELRPLSCRIFPLAPHVAANGAVTVLPDPRARHMCPLAEGTYLDGRFRRAVTRAMHLLGRDEKMLAFMRLLSGELEELRRFG